MTNTFTFRTLLVATLLTLTPIFANAVEGGANPGGGDNYGGNFAAIGRKVAKAYSLVCQSSTAEECMYLGAYLQKVATGEAISAAKVFGRDNKERDAINDRNNIITVGRERFDKLIKLPDAPRRIVRLVIHEYLGLAQLEDSDTWTKSDSIVELLSSNFIDLATLAQVPKSPEVKFISCVCDISKNNNITSWYTEVYASFIDSLSGDLKSISLGRTDSGYGHHPETTKCEATIKSLQQQGVCPAVGGK
jgi:hypothetical protein